jgi:two-component system, OmpR family, sensor kinase
MSTGTRVAVAVALVLTVGIVVLSLVASWRVGNQLSDNTDRTLLNEAEAYSAALKQDLTEGVGLAQATRSYIQARAQSFSSAPPILLVRLADGHVLSNTSLRLEDAPLNATALDAKSAVRGFFDLDYKGAQYRVATVPVLSPGGEVLGVFEAALPTAPTRALATQVLLTLFGVGLVVTAAGAVIAVLAARASLRPLASAAATASRVSQSSLGERISYDGPDDEVGHLTSAVNEMLDRLERAFGEQRRFVADASHELRTPLAVVSGHLEMLRDADLDETERGEEIALISDEVGRMGRLVDDLLALARLDAGTRSSRQPLEVATLLEEAAARGRGLGERAITVNAAPDLWVRGDPDQLMQAFLNLVSNAVAHTTSGGAIALEAAVANGDIVVSVGDDGPGIRPADTERIFDRFFRAQGKRASDTGGSGLGLAITKRLIELHGGSISAGNRSGGGAVFTVRLPRISAPAE